ncbi:MAG: ABC-type transport system involved in resistance to organic solvent, ATPase component [Verrucomicrobia bacterium]|jgi:ABC-type transporter Mla maintaining outer membrane lipid asymmetry ATPase subunit MlaF|nr:ABC-type transport system involved in resistance to organic solvent, ATPase component [Verrucomicrobiota bacterium]
MADTKPKKESAVCVKLEAADLGLEGKGDKPLLNGINLQVNTGEFWVVGGMHRSGKSTLLASVAMLQKPLAGKIEIFGVDPWSGDEVSLMKQRLRVGLVFEAGARLLHKLTVAENIALPLCYHKDCYPEDASERVEELLKFAGVQDMARQLPGALTRTYRQRASLARALAMGPELLLLDNPLAGVDFSERAWWQETVTGLWRGHPIVGGKPMTIMVVTNHVTPWVAADRHFALLHENTWRQIGGMAELQASSEASLRDVLDEKLNG